MKTISLLFFMTFIGCSLKAQSIQDSTIIEALNNLLFVNYFKTVETRCPILTINGGSGFTIDSFPANSNAQYIDRSKMNKSDSDFVSRGIKCLSQYCARYLKFEYKELTTNTKKDSLFFTGTVRSTYSYPFPILVQYMLGLHKLNNYHIQGGIVDSTLSFYNLMLSSTGIFKIAVKKVDSTSPDLESGGRITLDSLNAPYNGIYTLKGRIDFSDCSIEINRMNTKNGDQNAFIPIIKFMNTDFSAEKGRIFTFYNEDYEEMENVTYANWVNNFTKIIGIDALKPEKNNKLMHPLFQQQSQPVYKNVINRALQ